ncbi:hypothetical protein D3C87_30100 [compost metagenome]
MKLYHHNYCNPRLKEYARELRTETVSKAEKYIWKGLLSRKQIRHVIHALKSATLLDPPSREEVD